MPACRLIVCEKTSHWAAALRGALGTRQPRLVETRSLAGCQEALAESPYSLVAVETTATNVASVVEFISSMTQRYPRATLVACLAEDAADAEMVAREAGAIDAIFSVLDAPRVARLARRQLKQDPPREIALSEFVADLLPWPAAATSSS